MELHAPAASTLRVPANKRKNMLYLLPCSAIVGCPSSALFYAADLVVELVLIGGGW